MSPTRPLSFLILLLMGACLTLSCGGGHANHTTIQSCDGCEFVFSTTDSGQILSFPVSTTNGALGTPTSVAGPANSTGLVTNEFVLYASDPASSAVRVYQINQDDGSLSASSAGPYGVNSTPGELVIWGSTLYVASPAGIFAFSINPDGSLAALSGSPYSAGAGLSHLAVVSSSGNFLYAANSDDPNGSISAFTIASNGALSPVPGSPFATVPNGGPEGFYNNGNFLYVALKNANAVAAMTIAADGSLSPVAGSPFSAGRGTLSLAGAGGFVFAANSLDGTISSYIDSSTGALTQVTGSPFAAVASSGDLAYGNGTLFLPDTSANTINAFAANLTTGAVAALPGSPFRAGASPLSLTVERFECCLP